MDTSELKKLLKGSTAVLILEDGEPSFVILGYDAYKGLLSDRPGVKQRSSPEIDIPLRRVPHEIAGRSSGQFHERVGEKESELLEKINKQILALKDEVDKEEKMAGNPHID